MLNAVDMADLAAGDPHCGTEISPGVKMPVFYRGEHAVVTDKVIDVLYTGRRSFELERLSDVHVVQCGSGQHTGVRHFLGASALMGAVLSVPIVGSVSQILMALAVAGQIIAAMFCLHSRVGASWCLRATYVGDRVDVFLSRNEGEFNAVRRGLIRSLEYRSERAVDSSGRAR